MKDEDSQQEFHFVTEEITSLGQVIRTSPQHPQTVLDLPAIRPDLPPPAGRFSFFSSSSFFYFILFYFIFLNTKKVSTQLEQLRCATLYVSTSLCLIFRNNLQLECDNRRFRKSGNWRLYLRRTARQQRRHRPEKNDKVWQGEAFHERPGKKKNFASFIFSWSLSQAVIEIGAVNVKLLDTNPQAENCHFCESWSEFPYVDQVSSFFCCRRTDSKSLHWT